MANDLLVRILGDTKGLERSFARANQATATFGRNVETTAGKADKATRSFKGLAAGAGAGFAGGLVVSELLAQGRAAVDVASNLQEQLSKSNVIFGKSAAVIAEWSETTAESMGIARDEAVAAAATFGTIFTAAGRSTDDAARLSKSVVQLAADLASFNNTSVEDSLTALRSGLSGEIEPLRRFQVFLTEAAVAQEAMAQSGKRSAKELTQGEKILARYALITQQTAKQSGDFERTQDSLANKQRTLSAQTRDLQGKIGNGLVPVMEAYVGFASQAVDMTVDLGEAMKALGEVKIPVIEIPLKVVFDKGTSTFGANFLKGLLPPQLGSALPFIEAIQDLMKPDQMANEISVFLAETLQGIIDDAISGVPAFGITPLPTTGEQLARTFAEGIQAAIDAAQAAAAAAIKEGNKRIAADEASDKFKESLEGLELKLDKAEATKGFADDRKVLAEIEALIRARIAKVGKTTELMRLLFQVDQRQAQIVTDEAANAAEAREKARAAVQASQFRSLGLDKLGQEIVPKAENLAKRISSVLEKVASGQLKLPSKLVERLKLARKLIRQEGGKLTAETRDVINGFLKAATGEVDKATGPLTKTSSLNANKILEGLGLGPDMERELRARLSSFNSAGRSLSGATRPTGQFSSQPVEVTVNSTTTLDGQVIARSTTKEIQKNGRRNPAQKRGPNSRRSGI